MQQRCIWQRAAAGLTVAALMIGATVAVAQVSGEFVQDRLIRIAPEEGSADLQVEPLPDGENVVESKHWIGLLAGPVPELLRKHLRLGDEAGVLVLSVVEGSPAAEAGIAKDDIVMAAAGKDLTNPRDLIDVVREHGDAAFELAVIHEGERSSVQVTPAERPEGYAVTLPQNQEENLWQIVPDDMPEVRNWLERLPQGEGLGFRSLGPGMLFRGGQLDLQNLPSGLSVQVHKEGDGPAKFKVQKGDQSWEFDADDKETIEQLPEDVRNAVEGMLGGRGATFSFGNGDVLRQLDQNVPHEIRPFGRDEIENRMKEMESRINELVEELGRLQSEK
jgi:membrane-associated protease RseP (regulator of RpoE activity)